MSLDKFVMRGYTSSTGQSTGQWVAQVNRDTATPQAPSAPLQQGASFVMGGTGKPSTPIHSRKGRREYDFDEDAVRAFGSTHGNGHCNGGGGCGGGGLGTSYSGLYGTPGSQKLIMFMLFIAVAIIALFMKYSGKGVVEKAKRGEPAMMTVEKGAFVMPRQSHPVWSNQ